MRPSASAARFGLGRSSAPERRKAAPAAPAAADSITLDTFATKFLDHKVKPSGKKTWENDKYMLAQLGAFVLADGTPLGTKALGTITEDDLEAFYAHLRAVGRAASTRNQYVQVIKASFRWATKKGYLPRNPVTDESALLRTKIAQRSRRLTPDEVKDGKITEPGEERRLIAVTGKNPGMQRLIIAALETCCRRGEFLSLVWADVNLARGEIRIRAEKAKDGDDRVLPISTRLAAVLEMAKTDPAGEAYKPEDHVFGDCGQPVKNTKRAWLNACARAGITDLHFHDLRHEGASRLLEAGWPLHQVRDMLGHASIDQTDTYLNAGRMGLAESMKRFDPARCNPVVTEAEKGNPPLHNEANTTTEHVTVN